ncbi:MAG: 30S ribosomal protein S3 [Dehalococcoidia bacterium]|nr:30S ribosomal protein S3 [Dehalococcoidia bacterium]
MGQKVHPHGFRLGYIYDWNSKWYADRNYTELLHEDLSIRRAIAKMLPDAGISRVDIERNANQVTVSVHTARPGIVIGRGGQRVDELRGNLEKVSGRKVRVNINEIRLPELDAALVARAVTEQIERRVSHRRAIKQAAQRAMQRGAQGISIKISGRLGGADMSRKDKERQGRVPLHTLRADVDYGTSEARTTLGRIGVKVWIYKGDIIAERHAPPRAAEAEGAEEAASTPAAEQPTATAVAETPAAEPTAAAVAETPIAAQPAATAVAGTPAAATDAAQEEPPEEAP